MKNYFFFDKKEQSSKVNFKELDHQITNFQLYMSFFHPRYTYRSLDNFLVGQEIHYQEMNTHDYLYITERGCKLNGIEVPLGTVLVSNARNEGKDIIKDSLQYYFLQPSASLVYYTIHASPYSIINTQRKTSNLDYSFLFMLVNQRWYAESWATSSGASRTFDFTTIKAVKEENSTSYVQGGFYQKEQMQPDSTILYFSGTSCDELITDYNIEMIETENSSVLDFSIEDEDFNQLIVGHNIKYILY